MHATPGTVFIGLLFLFVGIPACIIWLIAVIVFFCRRNGQRNTGRWWNIYLPPLIFFVPALFLANVLREILWSASIYLLDIEEIHVAVWPIWVILLLLWLVIRKMISKKE